MYASKSILMNAEPLFQLDELPFCNLFIVNSGKGVCFVLLPAAPDMETMPYILGLYWNQLSVYAPLCFD